MKNRRLKSVWIGILVTGSMLPRVAAAQAIVVDHTAIPLFEKIPEQYLEAARGLRVLFMDRSVGVNTHDALNCLTAAGYGSSRVPCRTDHTFTSGAWRPVLRDDASLARGEVSDYIRFIPSPSRYDRSKWLFYLFHETWDRMTESFISGLHNGSIPVQIYPSEAPAGISPLDFDVVSFQFGYLNVDRGSTISEFFSRRPGKFDDVYDLEREIGEHLTSATPRRVFVYWTTNLARSIGTPEATDFNDRMRRWCRENGKVLFDFADILAHDSAGRPCYDNRDGVPYTTPSGNRSENYPDDGRDLPAICQEKTTETDGGHLSTAQGVIGVAKGLWITVARIAGWKPDTAENTATPQKNP